jgi:hypothetical protein
MAKKINQACTLAINGGSSDCGPRHSHGRRMDDREHGLRRFSSNN